MPTGKVNPISLLLVLAVVGGIWALIDLAPAYLDNLDVDEVVTSTINTAAKGRLSDDQLAALILAKTDKVGTHWGEDSFGNLAELPGLGITREDITIERDTVANRISITVEYDREMRLKPLQRRVRIHFAPKREGAIPP